MMNARNARNAIAALVVLAGMEASAITATKEYVDKKDGAISNALETAKTELQSALASAWQSATNYTDAAIAAIPPVDLSDYATKAEIQGKVEGQILAGYYADIDAGDLMTIRLHDRTDTGATMTVYFDGEQYTNDHFLEFGMRVRINNLIYNGHAYNLEEAILNRIDDTHVEFCGCIVDEDGRMGSVYPAQTVELLQGGAEVITDFVANLGTDAAVEAIRAAVPQPDLSGYATTNALDEAIANIDLSAKQDALPYATNAIPQAAVSGLVDDLSHKVPLVKDKDGNYTAVSIGFRNEGSTVGQSSLVQGSRVTASGIFTHAEGFKTTAEGDFSHAEGAFSYARGYYSHAEGNSTYASGLCSHADGAYSVSSNAYSYAWQGISSGAKYGSHGDGTYNLNPVDGLAGLWIGERNMQGILGDYATTSALDAVAQSTAANTAALANCVTAETVNQTVTSALNTYTDQKTGVVWTGVMYDGNLYYVAVTNAPSANP